MKTSDFYFDLPEELIAQEPLKDRASSRLMVVHKDSGEREHRHFRDIKEYLKAGDCLVINNTKVLPARLYGERVGTGAAMEILLLVRRDMDTWEVLVRPGKKAKIGKILLYLFALLAAYFISLIAKLEILHAFIKYISGWTFGLYILLFRNDFKSVFDAKTIE